MSNKKHPLEQHARGNPFATGDPFLRYYGAIREADEKDETTNVVDPDGTSTEPPEAKKPEEPESGHEEPTKTEEPAQTDLEVIKSLREALTNAINHLRDAKEKLSKLGLDTSNSDLTFAKDEANKELDDLIEFTEKLEAGFDAVEESAKDSKKDEEESGAVE